MYILPFSFKKKKKSSITLPHIVEYDIIKILLNDRWLLPFSWRISLSLVCRRWFKQVSMNMTHLSIAGTRKHYRSLLNHIDQPACIIRSQNISSIHFNDEGIELGEFGGYLPFLLNNDLEYASDDEEEEYDVYGIDENQNNPTQMTTTVNQKRYKRLAKHPLRYVHERHAQQLRSLYFPQNSLVSLELVWTNSGLLAPLLKDISFPLLRHFKFTYNKYPPLYNFDPCQLLKQSPLLESLHIYLLAFDLLPELSHVIRKQLHLFRKISIVTYQHAHLPSHQTCWNLLDILNQPTQNITTTDSTGRKLTTTIPISTTSITNTVNTPHPFSTFIPASSSSPSLSKITYFKLSILPTRDNNIPGLFNLLSGMVNLQTLILQIVECYHYTNDFNIYLKRYLSTCDAEQRPLARLSSSVDIELNMLSALKLSSTLKRISINFSKYSLPYQSLRLYRSFKPQFCRLDLFKLPQHDLLVYDLLNSNPHLRSFTIRNCNGMTEAMSQVIQNYIKRSDIQLSYFKLKLVPYLQWSLIQMHKSLSTTKSICEVKIQVFFPHSTPTLQMRSVFFKPAIDRFIKKPLPNIDIQIQSSSDYHELQNIYQQRSTFIY